MMPQIFNTIEGLARSFQERLTVTTVYGDPITAGAVTVVPVAKVQFGFGGGGGGGSGEGDAEHGGAGTGGGGGGGGGGKVDAVGYIEISDAGSRWVPMEKPRGDQLIGIVSTVARILPAGGRKGLFAAVVVAIGALLLSGQFGRSGAPSPGESLGFEL